MKFTIPFAAYSVNNYYYGDKRHGKRAEAKQWEYSVNWELCKHQVAFEQLRASFIPSIHAFKVSFVFSYKSFFNKAGTISSKVFDISNCEKPLLDLIFNPCNNGPAPYKSPNVNIDDKFVIEMHSKKVQGDSDSIEITIELVNI